MTVEQREGSVAEARREAERMAAQPAFIERLAEKLGAHASASAVFGQPVERDGVTVIPVAKVRYGFGGGAGSGHEGEKEGEGGGGGGGLMASPLGYIEIQGGQATFKPIRDAANLAPLALAAGLGAWLALRGLRSIFR
jgi:uncharacterized spore protein YtfJ